MIESLALLSVWAAGVFIHSLLSKNVWHVAMMGAITAALVTVSVGVDAGLQQGLETGAILFAGETAFLLSLLYRLRNRPVKIQEEMR